MWSFKNLYIERNPLGNFTSNQHWGQNLDDALKRNNALTFFSHLKCHEELLWPKEKVLEFKQPRFSLGLNRQTVNQVTAFPQPTQMILCCSKYMLLNPEIGQLLSLM